MIYLDGIGFSFLIKELKNEIQNSRISKINVYDTNSFSIQLLKHHLYFDNKNEPIVYLSYNKMQNTQYENPFVLSLRKYILGALIRDVYGYNQDRLIIFDIEKLNMLGIIEKYKLIFELFPKSSNVILVDENDNIKAVMYVNIKMKRKLVTNAKYEYPESVSPYGKFMKELSDEKRQEFSTSYKPLLFSNNVFTYNKFYNLDYTEFKTLNDGFNEYFKKINEASSIQNKKRPLVKFVNKNLKRLEKILEKNKQDIENNKDYEKYKIMGDLLAANIYKIKYKDENIRVLNYYTNEEITIELDKNLSASKNVEKMYSKYAKAKRREENLNTRTKDVLSEISYYNEQLLFIDKEQDLIGLEEIEKELGLLNNKIKVNKDKKRELQKIEYMGYNIYIGRNNIENDKITFEIANNLDLWFHAKDVPGSHVILSGKNPSNEVIMYAATLAAKNSKSDGNVLVDYCLKKYVKKIAHAKKGQVIYDNYKSIKV
ncbi:Rqc2 family fibronectin-binding protein [Caviibacter abscessus]|uniref:Rqc2 family fibronectin-binding protein n=1 Tax=Caviibacter abscessus TaxID=1766719 RepID=UPI0008375E1A|nr:NFACT family protein [Caviibacter abscessus]